MKQKTETDLQSPLQLLGGLSAAAFMKRHWQRKPLLIRQALPSLAPLLDRTALFDLAGLDGVESRLVSAKRVRDKAVWRLRQGPFQRRSLPALSQKDWTLLVQGVDLHVDAVHDLLQQFRFVPDARLDDLMISYASDGGGVGPHFDSYDVFLLQVQGRRRWRIGRQQDLTLKAGVPLKILANFVAEQEFVLDPGDMLYLPPRYAHDGIAMGGDCMTYSVGFRAPAKGELARELLQRLAEDAEDTMGESRYRDPGQVAVSRPGAIPAELEGFARRATALALKDAKALPRVLGEYLTEPKSSVWFESGSRPSIRRGVVLDRRTRMMYDAHHIFINGDSYRAGGRDARLMQRLADVRALTLEDMLGASEVARTLLLSWCKDGWAHGN